MIKILFIFHVVFVTCLQLQAGDIELSSGNISQAKFSPDGQSVSWIVKDGRNYQLFVRNGKGEIRKLFDSLYRRTFYNWSPDGETIAFTGKKGRKGILHILKVESGSDKVLGEGLNPVFMPDGKTLLFFSLKELCAYDLKSGKIRHLSDFKQRQAFEQIAVSGKDIYFSCNGDLWYATLNQKASLLMSHDKQESSVKPFFQNPVVSVDGKYLYVSLITDGLYAMATDNQLGRFDLKKKSMTSLTDANSWAISPDGKKLIYCIGSDLKFYPGREQLCRGTEPVFSPDGRKIVYLLQSGWDKPPKLMLKTLY